MYNTAQSQMSALGCQGIMSGTGPQYGAEGRQPEVLQQIDSLIREVGELEVYVSGVEEKFSPVLQPSNQDDANKAGSTPYHTVLGSQLGEIGDRIRRARHRLESVLQRAEI